MYTGHYQCTKVISWSGWQMKNAALVILISVGTDSVWVCVCVCLHAHACARDACMCACMRGVRTKVWVSLWVFMHVCLHACKSVWVCVHACMSICVVLVCVKEQGRGREEVKDKYRQVANRINRWHTGGQWKLSTQPNQKRVRWQCVHKEREYCAQQKQNPPKNRIPCISLSTHWHIKLTVPFWVKPELLKHDISVYDHVNHEMCPSQCL